MLTPAFTKRFEKDLALSRKRNKDGNKLKAVMQSIVDEQPLPPKHRDHALSGDYAGRRECHVESDWLLIYKLQPGEVVFERTGTHSDLF